MNHQQAGVPTRDLYGFTVLHQASQAGDVERIMALISAGAKVNARDDRGITPLKYASAEPHLKAIQTLLELGADAKLADDRGFTPLHCAAGHGFYEEAPEIVALLIQHGADVNARSTELGFVPLHEATGSRVIELLLIHGADPSITNNRGLTPLQYMMKDGRLDDAAYLESRIAGPV
jgi:ankyrin repeat protein